MSNLTPKVPGQTVETQLLRELRSRVKELVGVSNFPGAQPISFTSAHLQELQNENYFVCEKTDGTRVLVYITCDNSGQQVFLIDRKNYYRLVPNLYFPIHNDPTFSHFHYETLIDGELVNDSESDGKVTLKLLTFDLLVIDKKDLMSRPLTSRLGYLKDHIIGPHKAMLSKCSDLAQIQPFVVELKQMELSYGLDKVLKEVIPNLKHKSDGLIFTSSIAGYKTGTCEKMLKWKPPHENSIDFQLYLDFSHVKNKGEKPRFCLYKWIQKDDHAYFGEMYVTDKEWEEFWRHDCNKYNGRIAEVVYDVSMNPHIPWRFIRFRDDKPHANHHTVVEKIIQSIMDGITQDQLLSHTPVIRHAWKRRDEEDKRREEDKRLKRVHEDKSENEESLANDNRPKRVKHDHGEDKFENEDKGVWKEESSANDTQSLKHDHENVKKLQYEEDENRISNGYLEYTAKNNKEEEEENPSETLY